MARHPAPLRILCHGDSLTHGFHCNGLGEHPYSLAMRAALAAALPADEDVISVVTDGSPGAVACREHFQRRLRNSLEALSFHWVIILGGTNDLAYGISPEEIFSGLKACWDLALARGSKVLALTVPECYAKSESLDGKRGRLNARILNHKQKNFWALDLFAKIPYHSLSEEDREKYWDDGLHLREEGYDWMGRHIADGLLAIIKQQSQPQPMTRKRRDGSDDQAVTYDEEAGSSNVISQGYVVVRRRDLD